MCGVKDYSFLFSQELRETVAVGLAEIVFYR